ncbi:MAG: HEAT repeat domain-containing protein [Planctomycetia bacterium]|nr:HEAT repeat domain-containing protein [Planctomycetia bacterium]
MDRGIRGAFLRLLLAGCLLGISSTATAQDDDAPAAGETPDLAAPLPVDPSRSPLAADPKSPEELFEATLLMVDVARLDLADLYLSKLLSETLDDDVLLALRAKFGAAAFLRLAAVPKLNPGAEKLLDLSNAAAIKFANDPERIAQLIADLDGNPEKHAVAAAELISLGQAVVPGLLAVLADAAHPEKHESVMDAILMIRERAIPPLIGALTAPDPSFRGHVITLLGELHAAAAVPYLWLPSLAADQPRDLQVASRTALARILDVPLESVERLATEGTVSRLLASVREHFHNQHPWKADTGQDTGQDTGHDTAGKITLWAWNDQLATVAARSVSREEASDIVGLRLAREALALAPQLRRAQVSYLCFALANDARRAGFDRPLPEGPGTAHDAALSAGSEVAVDVITEAVAANRAPVAVAALKVFSQVGTLAQLQLGAPQKSVVVSALDFPDPRVQFAAASAILQIDPTTPFRGAVRVVDVLKRSLVTDGRAHAVVGEVSPDRGAMIGGILRELGYEPLVFNSGRDAFAAAASRTDVELVVLHPNIIRWPLSETLANLRSDSRTASIPVVVHGPSALAPKLQRTTRNFRLVSYSWAAETTSDFDRQLTPLLRQVKSTSMTAQERSAQRTAAAAWFAHLAQGRRLKVFDITTAEPELANILDDDEVSSYGLEALGEIATQTSQRRIAGVVLDPQARLDLRRTAAAKLAFHVQRFGLMLSKSDVEALRAVWESAREPAELRTAVGGVIGSLKPDAALAGKRLKQQSGKSR